jgi:very-short-patch-repair endonuclease
VQDLKQFFEPGTLIALPCSDLQAGLAALKSECDRLRIRVVSLHWESVGNIDGLLDEALEGLARIAFTLWPKWYDRLMPGEDSSRPAWRQQFSPLWRETAEQYCSREQLPLPRGYAAAEQVTQLALTLAPNDLAIAIAVNKVREESVLTLRAAGEWLASNTLASVFILLPASDLPGIKLREGLRWSDVLVDPTESVHSAPEDRKPWVDVFPVVGAPHPLSPGEQKLAECILADPELAPLFAFNQRITGTHGNSYTVDLVCPIARLIVEVDSYQLHNNRFAFANDRHRDYELLASNYRVLRVTHDEAANDTPSALAKIRQLVRLTQQSSKPKEGVLS